MTNNSALRKDTEDVSAYVPSSDIKEDIKRPLERVLPHLMKELVGPDAYSWYAAVVLMFNHIDLLGHLYAGGSSPQNHARYAVEFIRKYFGQVDCRYEEVGGLLYYVLRHGLTHKSIPKRIKIISGDIVGLRLSDTKRRDKHLTVTRDSNELRLSFSVVMFYQDLLDAIDLFSEDVKKSKKQKSAYNKAWRTLGEAEEETSIKVKYVGASDFQYVKKQAINLAKP